MGKIGKNKAQDFNILPYTDGLIHLYPIMKRNIYKTKYLINLDIIPYIDGENKLNEKIREWNY